MIKKLLRYGAILSLLIGCAGPKPAENEIVGTWKSADGAVLQFTSDDSVHVTRFPLSVILLDSKYLLSGKGTWKIIRDPNAEWWTVELLIKSSQAIPMLHAQNNGLGIELYAARSGKLGNGPAIKNLFIWKGDPDADDRYEFVK